MQVFTLGTPSAAQPQASNMEAPCACQGELGYSGQDIVRIYNRAIAIQILSYLFWLLLVIVIARFIFK